MFLRFRICSTIFILYEIIAVMMLHSPRVCDAMFSGSFCMDSVYKYFIVCFAVPAVVYLIAMWIMSIVDGVRHRHSLMYKARGAVRGIVSTVRDRVSENVSTKDLEKMIAAALVVGIEKYVSTHPRVRNTFDKIRGVADKDGYDAAWAMDEEEEDDDEDEMPSRSKAQFSVKSQSRSHTKTVSKKKR